MYAGGLNCAIINFLSVKPNFKAENLVKSVFENNEVNIKIFVWFKDKLDNLGWLNDNIASIEVESHNVNKEVVGMWNDLAKDEFGYLILTLEGMASMHLNK